MKPAHRADREAELRAEVTDAAGRRWWRLVPLVVTRPRTVFQALREDDEDDVAARQEPILAIVLTAGMAATILTPTWGRLLGGDVDAVTAVVLTFVGGGFGGGVMYYLLGLALWAGTRGAGALHSMRLVRQVVGFSALPIALSFFLTLPIVLIAFGGDFFRPGGSDEGVGRWVVIAIGLAAAAWSVGLLLLGLRRTLRLPWRGVATAAALATVAVALVAVVPYALDGSGG